MKDDGDGDLDKVAVNQASRCADNLVGAAAAHHWDWVEIQFLVVVCGEASLVSLCVRFRDQIFVQTESSVDHSNAS